LLIATALLPVVTQLDRLARSILHLTPIADELQRKQVHLHVIDQNIDTSYAAGRLLFNMLGKLLSLKPN
jgi:DNA invertase Pin-like site-specific DNA recombinase